jgi:hypothetical protein
MTQFDTLADVSYKFEFENAVLLQMEMQARRRLHSKRPEIWAFDVLGVTLWSKQVLVAHSIVEHKNTMVAAGHGVGKSYLTAVLACWWIDTHAIGAARVLSTAPTTAQVRGIVWREIQLLHRKSKERYQEYLDRVRRGEPTDGLPDHPLPGYVTSSGTWRNFDGLELGAGRTPPRGREGDAFQGIHGGVFAIADEAVGVGKEMIDTLANNTTADEDRVLLIANPTNPNSEMGQIWNDSERAAKWSRITISVLESPHFTDEGKSLPETVMKYMTNHQYVIDKKLEYGEDSANYKARVKGEWALDSGMILFPDEVLEVGLATTVTPDPSDIPRVGFDISRSEKGDWSYLYEATPGWVYKASEWRDGPEGWNDYPLDKPVKTDRRGLRIRFLDRWRGIPFFPLHNESGQRVTEEAANERVNGVMTEIGARELRYDADGMGKIMGDAMLNVMDGSYTLIPIKGNGASPDRDTWYNLRAYSYSELARRMRMGEIDIQADQPEFPLVRQLGAIEYTFAAGFAESLLIMSKKDMAKKGIKSPDAADAAWYAAAEIELEEFLPAGSTFDYDMSTFERGMFGKSNAFWG